MFFETLENRSLFSVSLSAGVLTVTGTPAADVISIVKNASGGITVTDDGVVDNFSSVSVAHVAVNAG
ncbi:MAG TPA: hypothetical protein VLI90_13205, partial [Tepidisphaeraceae bacterium]|nr:hypothetical protein [Tepidisphaeraceae bacterium]